MRPSVTARLAAVLLSLASAAGTATPQPPCKPFDAAEVRTVLRLPVGAPKATVGAALVSCTAQAGGGQVTLSYTLEPDRALGSEGEFQQSLARARAAGRVEAATFKDTRCASLLPSGGSKFGAFKAWCVLHSMAGRAVTLEVLAPNAKQLPALQKVAQVAAAAATRIP
jgi:hypothetical protein